MEPSRRWQESPGWLDVLFSGWRMGPLLAFGFLGGWCGQAHHPPITLKGFDQFAVTMLCFSFTFQFTFTFEEPFFFTLGLFSFFLFRGILFGPRGPASQVVGTVQDPIEKLEEFSVFFGCHSVTSRGSVIGIADMLCRHPAKANRHKCEFGGWKNYGSDLSLVSMGFIRRRDLTRLGIMNC